METLSYRDLYHQGVQLLHQQEAKKHKLQKLDNKELQETENIFATLLNYDVSDASSIYNLASTFILQKHYGVASLLLKQTLEIDPDFADAYNNLGICYRELGDLEKVSESFHLAMEKSIIRLEKNEQMKGEITSGSNIDEVIVNCRNSVRDCYNNVGSMYVANGTPDKAIEFFDKCLEMDEGNEHALWNKGLALLEKGDYEQGWEFYHRGSPDSKIKARTYTNENNIPEWDGSPGKTVVIYGSEGLGDELLHMSVVRDALKACKEIILDCHPRLVEMLRRAFPGVAVYGTRKQFVLTWPSYYKIDAKICGSSLMRLYRKHREDYPRVPYLTPDVALHEQMREWLSKLPADKLKVGISWQGGSKKTNRSFRYIKPELWKPILEQDACFISLQYNPEAVKEVRQFKEMGYEVIHDQRIIDDYDLTAALLPHLDLIITVPQSLVHLAGDLEGAPEVLQLCSVASLWQCGPYGESPPWYANVTNIWQKERDDWSYPVAEAAKRLKQLIEVKREGM